MLIVEQVEAVIEGIHRIWEVEVVSKGTELKQLRIILIIIIIAMNIFLVN